MKKFILLCGLFVSTHLFAFSVVIVTAKTVVGPWDPNSIQNGITGSEEAVIYVAQKLADLGCEVIVYTEIPPNCPYSTPESNPRYVDFDYRHVKLFDIVISWRMPQIAEPLKEFGKKVFFWPHDLCNVSLTLKQIDAFDDVLWLSHSQREQWSSLNPALAKFKRIFGNGINPDQFEEIQERENPYSCIYASSYTRGLAHLLDIWPSVKKYYPRATLDIYYGWQAWSPMPKQLEQKMKGQIQAYGFLGVKEHGQVGHLELHRAYERASLWTYPCTALITETFCISALKAQFAGAVPVVINGSALKETVQHGYKCNSADQYLSTLLNAMGSIEQVSVEERKKQRQFVLEKYTWEEIAKQWKELFEFHLDR